MQLTKHTDIALRTLLLLASRRDDPITIGEIARSFRINRHHLTKVVAQLVHLGYVEAKRGRIGGLTLAQDPERITIATVVHAFEPGFDLLECFTPATSTCPITGNCQLKRLLHQALEAFLKTLMDTTVADAVGDPATFRRRLGA